MSVQAEESLHGTGPDGAVPIRNTTLNASGRLEPHEPLPEPPRYVVATVEHLLAALAGLGVWHGAISIEGPEVPILDGSAKPFVDALQKSLSPAPPSVGPSSEWSIRLAIES